MKTFPQAMGHCSLMTVKCNSISDACKLRCPLCISLPRVVSVYIFLECAVVAKPWSFQTMLFLIF